MLVTTILELLLLALIMTGVTAGVYALQKRTKFGEMPFWTRQIIIGVLYGALACAGTEFGVDIGGATANIRDAAPLCAGLLFGGPAGIIAGVIGGVERWFAALWGAGMYTRVACSVATVAAGLFAAALRKHMFDDKKPSWFAALNVGLVMEVFHMLLVFVTNMSDVHAAFSAVQRCALPMIIANGAAVSLSALAVTLMGGERVRMRERKLDITQRFQSVLFVCVVIAFLCTCAFTFVLQTRLTDSDTDDLLLLNIEDVRADIEEASDANLLALTQRVATVVDTVDLLDGDYLKSFAKQLGIAEIDIVNSNGIIIDSTNADFVGYDMESDAQSAAFMVLLNGQTTFVQDYQPIGYDNTIYRKYAGCVLKDGGFVQVGYDGAQLQADIAESVSGITQNRHVGENGSIIICDNDMTIVSDRLGSEGSKLSEIGMSISAETPENERFIARAYGEDVICTYATTEGYSIIAMLPVSEANMSRDLSLYVMAFMEIVLFAAVFIQIYMLIKRIIVDNIHRINSSLSRITGGDLSVQVDVRNSTEFASLSDDINATVGTLKRYIAEAEARIDRELAFAKEIQHSALPSVFPPFPERHEFEIYAMMQTAKEVGGDFYDFYMIDDVTLAFLIADVSGKGIPAAMFMMRAKTLIKSLAETGMPLSAVFTQANTKLCESNEAGMFVTAWLGALNIETGVVQFVNAGHNPPLIRRDGGEYEYFKTRPGFVLAGMEGVKYRAGETKLSRGDRIFLYTDGVTEATNSAPELFGEDRLLSGMNECRDMAPDKQTEFINAKLDEFVAEAPQFDDITMLSLTYLGDPAVREWSGTPDAAATAAVTDFVEQTLCELGCPMKFVFKMNIAVDELFTNIVSYSGATEARVICSFKKNIATLKFMDNGTPYDPTAQKEPDTTLSAEEREIGGLGIHMVKKSMDSVEYKLADGWNVLVVKKEIN